MRGLYLPGARRVELRFPLERGEEPYALADSGRGGKVCIVFD